ncbi:Enoyl- hydratase isomerase [Neofusicoccum parvum]|uniref:Putative enoyl-hydratase isomerase family protein n=1 Tax=Botryosphaeria parva (strain UCR-NP2) TaxID=1287680 RepID=R1GDG1_BOTPV|nr:putative enoyl- hydratase isomerase family protein [Neofusicoccum parvum UCRNP2]GME66114.1 Enoyl- hydratase isomerase [Neofusicoccum parvum]
MSSNDYSYEYFNVSFPQEYVAHVEINRPEKLNAFIEAMWLNLSAIFTRLSADPAIRAILLTGAGPRAFCAGLDVQAASKEGLLADASASGPDPARKAFHSIRHIAEFQACISALEACAKPVVAVLHGVSFGLALDMSLACDVRLAAADARLSVKEVDIGIAADIGTLTRLPKSVGSLSWVKDVTLTARVFGAQEAAQVGLVSGPVYATKDEAVAAGLEKCGLMASKSPVAVQGTKELVNYSRDRPTEEGLRYTAVWNSAMLQTDDIKDALLSGIKKTKPKFAKL